MSKFFVDDNTNLTDIYMSRNNDDPIIDFDTDYKDDNDNDIKKLFYPYFQGDNAPESGYLTKDNSNNIIDLSDIFQYSQVPINTYTFGNTPGPDANEEFNNVLQQYFQNPNNIEFSDPSNFPNNNYPNPYYGPINLWNTINITDMSYIFNSTPDNINFNEDISKWNTSNVTNMKYMFYGQKQFNQDLSNWNTSNVTNMSYMFYNCQRLDIDSFNWNTSNVTNMSYMFYFCKFSFNPSEMNLDVSNVTDFSRMFANANKFDLNINFWNVSETANLSRMFQSTKLGLSNRNTFGNLGTPPNDWFIG